MSRDEDTSGLFRQVNEQIQKLSTTFGLTNGERLQIICECSRSDCAEPIEMTMDEYEQMRSHPAFLTIKPNHPSPNGAEPESKNDRYWIVASSAPEEQESRAGA